MHYHDDLILSEIKGLHAGVDEAGRGPLAGPVIAAAVILDPQNPIDGLRDSKQLSHKRREQLAQKIKTHALAFAIGRAEVEEIDRINIFKATLLAMQRAMADLMLTPSWALIDGKHCPELTCQTKAIVKGDTKVPAISAASILAKVARDAEMLAYDAEFPVYGFAQHKGYGTRQHLAAIKTHGICRIHRRSYAPVRAVFE